jgi:hypothetical protein
MTENFHHFAKAVHQRLALLSKDELFVVDGVDLYTSYLLGFPEGADLRRAFPNPYDPTGLLHWIATQEPAILGRDPAG